MGLALITGASAGLGREFAKVFSDNGHNLILVGRRREKLDEIARAIRGFHAKVQVYVIEQDLGKPGAGSELFTKVGALRLPPVDFLINNAGFGTNGPFSASSLERELELIDLNIRALLELTHLFLPAMLGGKSGRILNVGSTAGFQPGPNMANYYASKAFVNSFSEGLQEELRGTGVTCTVLAPGATRTEFADVAKANATMLFKSMVASPQSVALAGYRGMMRGKTLVIPGFLNQLMVQLLRITPRFLARKLAGRMNR